MNPGWRFLANKYGLTSKEADSLILRPDVQEAVEAWREVNGFPHPQSPLVRGFLLDALKGAS